MTMIKGTKKKIVRNEVFATFISFPMTEELFNAIALNVAKQDVQWCINNVESLTDDELWNLIEKRKKAYILGLDNICMGDVVITDYDAETQTVHIKNILCDPLVIDLTLEQTLDKIIITNTYEGGNCILTINKKDGSFEYMYSLD